MNHGQFGTRADLRRAADIAGRDDIGRKPLDIGDLPVAKLARDFWLQNIIGARRSAAQMRFGRFADIVAGADEETRGRLHHLRSEEHTSELQSLMRISYAVFCL